ncbi:MAG: ABC transporter ATP-binding protein [archaeon]
MEEKIEVIRLENISKRFKIPKDRQSGLKGALLNLLRGNKEYEVFYVLKDINLSVKKGDFIGIIGRNGSGKSTLLKIIANVLKPTSGKIFVDGKISPFLELGVGFQGELSARDNIYLYGAILGLTRKEISKKFDDIIKFAELERFVDMKLKSFSSGMVARLGFSIAIRVDADIILIDEVLAVGDIEFQKKCFKYFENVRGKKTILFVSHDLNAIEIFCDKCLLIEKASLKMVSRPNDVIKFYSKQLKNKK